MGSGASAPAASSTAADSVSHSSTTAANRPVAAAMPIENEQRNTVVRENKVAPIIIKNCKEEFQHVTDFKEPIVYGRIAEGKPEHALIQNKYYLVRDSGSDGATEGMRRCEWSDYPVWGMGQPSRDSLAAFMQNLKEDGYKDILLVNLREEPVVFVADGFDMVAYSPRHQDQLGECYRPTGYSPITNTTDIEVQIRKECIDLATFNDDAKFYFYKSVENLENEPHMIRMAYDDDMAVTDEVYSRLSFNNSGVSYLRIGLPPDGTPSEDQMDEFINMFKHVGGYFDSSKRGSGSVPAIVFTSRSGRSRSTMGMVMGSLMLAHRLGFPAAARKNPYPINEKSPNFERGEFFAIQKLVKHLPNGLQIKHEVDCIIDQCSQLYNIRNAAAESKAKLEAITEDYIMDGKSAKDYFLQQCIKRVQVYFITICLNAYLHEQYQALFGTSFKQWMQKQSEIYYIFSHINTCESTTSPNLLISGERVLVADDYLGLDVLSSQMDVKTSNFRRVPGLPVYGMAQPSREGLSCVVQHLLNKKQGHPSVILINLRQDLTIECNGATYSIREKEHLEEPIILPEACSQEIEAREELLKKEVKAKKSFEVLMEVNESKEKKEFNSVLTEADMVEQQQMQTSQIVYHRLAMADDSAPTEKTFDKIMGMINGMSTLHSDEDGPALVFHCRTGKGRTTTAMAIAGLIVCHKKGFPYGTKPGEEERVSLPNAIYTQGNYKIVHDLVRRIPNGQQVKREVDFILNQCSETMTPMHYHAREVIFVTYNKVKKAKTEEERIYLKKRALDYLERYMYLILFNTYLHCERRTKWKSSFSQWMKEVASKVGVYDLLDNLAFSDFETGTEENQWLKCRRYRWSASLVQLPVRGQFV